MAASKKKQEIITLKPNTLRSPNANLLNINEQRILFFSIFKIQTNASSVSFTKAELEATFNVDFGSFKEIKTYMNSLRTFGMDIIEENSQKVIIVNAFSRLEYRNGLFSFKFNEDFLPQIDNQKRFLQYGMKSIEKFKCRYSIYLYDYLKDNMWGNISIKKNLSLTEFRAIFKIGKKYERNSNFESRVWRPALDEINMYTDYTINIVTKGNGKRITYTLQRIENEDLSKPVDVIDLSGESSFTCQLGKNMINFDCRNCMKINLCPYEVELNAINWNSYYDESMYRKLSYFMMDTFWSNKYYSLKNRIDNKVASPQEISYYNLVIKQAKELNAMLPDDMKQSTLDIENEIKQAKKFFIQAEKMNG